MRRKFSGKKVMAKGDVEACGENGRKEGMELCSELKVKTRRKQ